MQALCVMAQILLLLKRMGVLPLNSAETASAPLLSKSSSEPSIENLLKIQSIR